MDASEIRLRCVEAAAGLPAVRCISDPTEACEATLQVARLWYDEITGRAYEQPKAQEPARGTLSLNGSSKGQPKGPARK